MLPERRINPISEERQLSLSLYNKKKPINRAKMKTTCAMLMAVFALMNGGADAWGGLFNRFSPEMLSNMGYGSHGGYLGRSSAFLQVYNNYYYYACI